MNILEHQIYKDIYDLCQKIEELPASEFQTKLVTMAGNLANPAKELVEDKKRMDWLLVNSHIKVGEIYLTSRESLDKSRSLSPEDDLRAPLELRFRNMVRVIEERNVALTRLEAEVKDLRLQLAEKNETANIFMNRVKKLQAEIAKKIDQENDKVSERIAQLTAHRACGNQEQDLANGKLAGYCVVCQTLWPCDTAKERKI